MPDAASIADRLHSAAIHLLRQVRSEDERSGLTAARLSALSVLVFGGPRTLGDLAEAEQVRSPTMTRLVDGLEGDGLVVRRPSTTDRRAVVVATTAKGRRIMRQARMRRVAQVADRLAGLDARDLATLERAAAVLERVLSDAGSQEATTGGREPAVARRTTTTTTTTTTGRSGSGAR